MKVQRLREFLAVLPDDVDISCDRYDENMLLLSFCQQEALLDLNECDHNAFNESFLFEEERVTGFSFPPIKTEPVSVITNLPPMTEEQRTEWERLANEYRDLAKPTPLSLEEALQAVEQPFYAASLLVKPNK